MNTQETKATDDDISIEDLEAMMASFGEEEIVETADDALVEGEAVEAKIEAADEAVEEGAIDESLLKQAIRQIQVEEAVDKSYKKQASTDKTAGKKKKADLTLSEEVKVKLKAKPAKAPRATSFTHSRDELVKERSKGDFYLLEKADLTLSEEAKKVRSEEVSAMIKAMNVKVGAKCVNILSAMGGSAKLSTFIESGLRYALNTTDITHSDLVAYFMSQARNGVKAYGKGTATPQATNLLKLFIDLKVLKRDEGKYALNEESLIVEWAKGLFSAAKA